MKNLHKTILILVLLIAVQSCDAPHINPLDPENPDYKFGQLDGFVYNKSLNVLKSVKVIWKNQNVLTYTDANGYYKIEDIPRANGTIYFEKDGFAIDSLQVDWQNQKSKRLANKYLEYAIGVIDGYVSTPNGREADVKVLWSNQNILTTTNSSGYYKLKNLKTNDGKLYFEKDGLKKDSAEVKWNGQDSIRVAEKNLFFKKGELRGSVKTAALPSTGIPNVKVFWKNENKIVLTNASGEYTFNDVAYNDGKLYFEKEGYANDSIDVKFGSGSVQQASDVRLNISPVLENINITTAVTYRLTGQILFKIFVQASVTDKDDPIDTVFVNCSAINFNKSLTYNTTTKYYEVEQNYGTINLSAALGKDFNVTAKVNGKKYDIGKTRITRVIDKEIEIDSPKGVVVNSTPTLYWKRFVPGFSFKYRVEIWTDETPAELYWSRDNISESEIQITPEVTLPAGEYFWVIWCTDEYGNQTRSKEASFVVN